MFCSNCGKPISEDAKFCCNCGAPIQPIVAIHEPMPVVSENALAEEPLATEKIEASVPTTKTQATTSEIFIPGTELGKFKLLDKYTGTSSLASNLGTGTLHVYDNGLQFTGVLGASVGSGWLGVVASAAINIAQAYDPNTYPLEQIKELRVGKRLGVYNTLVISMKNGDTWSFCPALPGSPVPKQIIEILTPHMASVN